MRNTRYSITVALLFSIALASSAFAATTHTGKGVAAVTIVTETNDTFIRSTSFEDLPGATVAFIVPAGKTQLVKAEFTAESYCFGSPNLFTKYCGMRILADGVEMSPASGINYGWDTNGQSDDAWEGHALARSIVLGAGTHIIQLQAFISDPNLTFDLDDWSLTVTQYNNGK